MKFMNRIAHFAYVMAALFVSTSFSTVRADDTDIYVSNPPSPVSAPLVMFSIDYRPNLGSTVCNRATDASCDAGQYFLNDPATAAWVPTDRVFVYFDVLRLSLHKVLSGVTGVKVGLMMNHDSANNCAGPAETRCSGGGYIVKGFNQLVAGDTNNALKNFTSTLFALPTPQGNVSHTWQGKELYFEFFRYLTGQGVYNGHNGWTDYGDTDSATNLNVDFPAASWDTSIEYGGTYKSPLLASNACAKIFAINFLFQVSQQEDDSDDAINASKEAGGMAGIPADADFTTAINYMNDVDLADGSFGPPTSENKAPNLPGIQNVTSYFISDKADNKTPTEYAIAGGTQSALQLTEDPRELVDTLTSIFKEILSVSTTFVAASVPVNVFNRSESLDNVFIALFQAEDEPFWNGNLKKLKLAVVESEEENQTTRVELQDVNNSAAIAGDGRIKFDALTYWTEDESLPPPEADTEEVAGKDGRVVDRGAAGQKIPGYISDNVGTTNPAAGTEPSAGGPRKVLYDNPLSISGLAPLNYDDATASSLMAALGRTTTAEAKADIGWLRGIDVDDIDADGLVTDVRPWLLGDPLHSRPLPINYGIRDGHTEMDNPLIYIAMASNDGYMHFFRNTDGNGTELGKEVWAFVPTEIMDVIPIFRANNPTTPKHPYTVDGAPAAYLDDENGDGTISSDEAAYLYFGLRRGGRTYYALDITNPDAPKLAWTIDNETPGFEELGYTWSRPQVGKVDYDGDEINDPVPVLVFGGGYDPNKDARGGAVGTDDRRVDGTGVEVGMGYAIYVVNAVTGDLIWKTTYGSTTGASGTTYYHSDMVDSIPSDVTVVDTNADQLIDRAVVGDTGGNVWRVDMFGALANWKTTRLATIGRHYQSDTENDRRFFHKPDFVQAQAEVETQIMNPDGTSTIMTTLVKFDAVILGSGSRPNPLDKEYAVAPENWLYMIKDTRIDPAISTATVGEPGYVVDLDYTHAQLGDITDPDATVDISKGWKLQLEAGPGEKSLSTPLTLSNTIFFTTYLPLGLDEDQVTAGDGTDPATCGPSEGSGLLYAVNLLTGKAALNYNTSDDAMEGEESKEDRYKELTSGGIPADVVGINVDGQAYVLPPDLAPEKAKADTRWRTFWYEVEEDL